jgi:dTDP-4-dehydrorhamnose 3,5-epimerase-like enzyme
VAKAIIGNPAFGSEALPNANAINNVAEEMKNLNMFYVEQNAGDIMWVPAGLFHGVRNMTNTIALTFNLLLPQLFLQPDSRGLAELKFAG